MQDYDDDLFEEYPDNRWIKLQTRWDTKIFNMGSFCVLLFSVFLQGVDYSIVMPSMWAYIRYHNPAAREVFFGLTLSSFSLATALVSPLAGMYFDKNPMKPAIIFLTLISIFGSFIYGFAVNEYMILGGRIIQGVGALLYTAAAIYTIRTTTIAERSGTFAKINMMFAVAMFMGPLINLPLTIIGTYPYGPFVFSELSSPGIVMAGLFTLSLFGILFFFKEPKRRYTQDASRPRKSWIQEWKMILSNFPCMVLVITQFLVVYNQTVIETILTPLTKLWYSFDSLENSLLFAGMTVTIVCWLFIMGPLTRRFQDRTLLFVAHLMTGDRKSVV